MKSDPGAPVERRKRTRVRATIAGAHAALNVSACAARRGDLAAACRALSIAERHAKAARQLFDLDAELEQVRQARRKAEAVLTALASVHCLPPEPPSRPRDQATKNEPILQKSEKYFGPIDR